MGRKKKVQTETKQITEPKAVTVDSVNYVGNVKISIQKGKKVLSTKTYHNNGKDNLFKFLCNCLAGNYVSSLRPCKIALFTKGNSETETTLDWDTTILTPYILNDTTATVSASNNTYSTTFHFRIPFAYINVNTSSDTKIYKAAIFPNTLTSGTVESNICAYYLFKNGTSWDGIKISNNTGNLSLIIEWTMTIKNPD